MDYSNFKKTRYPLKVVYYKEFKAFVYKVYKSYKKSKFAPKKILYIHV